MSNHDHLTEETTDRGFSYLPKIEGDYGGNVSIRESSGAEAAKLWLTVVDQFSGEEATVHLVAEDAWHLAEQLMLTVKNHYQGDARPESNERFADIVDNTKE